MFKLMGKKIILCLKILSTKIYVVCTHKNHLNEMILLSTQKMGEKIFPVFRLKILSTETYVVGTHKNRLNETLLLSTQNIC